MNFIQTWIDTNVSENFDPEGDFPDSMIDNYTSSLLAAGSNERGYEKNEMIAVAKSEGGLEALVRAALRKEHIEWHERKSKED